MCVQALLLASKELLSTRCMYVWLFSVFLSGWAGHAPCLWRVLHTTFTLGVIVGKDSPFLASLSRLCSLLVLYTFYRVYIYEWVLTSVNRSCSLLVNFDLRSGLTRWVRFWCFILFLQLSPMPMPVVCFSEGQVSFLCHLNVCSFVDWLGRLCRLAGVGLRWCELGGEIDK